MRLGCTSKYDIRFWEMLAHHDGVGAVWTALACYLGHSSNAVPPLIWAISWVIQMVHDSDDLETIRTSYVMSALVNRCTVFRTIDQRKV